MVLKRILSMTLSRAGKIEIPAPLAVYYILDGSTMISFHTFSTLPFCEFINQLESENDATRMLEQVEANEYAPVPLTSDYFHGPSELEYI